MTGSLPVTASLNPCTKADIVDVCRHPLNDSRSCLLPLLGEMRSRCHSCPPQMPAPVQESQAAVLPTCFTLATSRIKDSSST